MSGDGTTILRPGGFFGVYRVVSLLGKGGMGEVYLVEDPANGNARFAVKVLSPEAGRRDSEIFNRFILEAEFAMKVRHPNLVEVYDAGVDPESGLCYLTMEYLSGGSLKDLIARSGQLSSFGVALVASDIARALALVAANGMVHRDVKPDNILFAADGTAKLADLGITRFDRDPGSTVTRIDGLVGTPAYMAPEQMLDSHAVDIRADIYSLGVVMFEMLSGRRPNEGEGAMRTLAKALDGRTFPDVRIFRPDASASLARLIAWMTLPNVESRPSSLQQVLEILTHPDHPTGSDRPSVPPRAWYRDRAVLYALTAMILALEALVLALVPLFTRN